MPLAARSAAIEATDTTAPRLASRCGSAARATAYAPVRLTAIMAAKSAADSSATPPGYITPALSTSPSSPPSSATATATSRCAASGSAMSQVTAIAPVSAATAASGSARRPQMTTWSPAAARARATAAPMPVPPPVTRIVLTRSGLYSPGPARGQVGQLGAGRAPGPEQERGTEPDHQQHQRQPRRPDRRAGDLVEGTEDGPRGDQDADDRRDGQPDPVGVGRVGAQRADAHQQVDHDQGKAAERRAPGEQREVVRGLGQREQPGPELVQQQRQHRRP